MEGENPPEEDALKRYQSMSKRLSEVLTKYTTKTDQPPETKTSLANTTSSDTKHSSSAAGSKYQESPNFEQADSFRGEGLSQILAQFSSTTKSPEEESWLNQSSSNQSKISKDYSPYNESSNTRGDPPKNYGSYGNVSSQSKKRGPPHSDFGSSQESDFLGSKRGKQQTFSGGIRSQYPKPIWQNDFFDGGGPQKGQGFQDFGPGGQKGFQGSSSYVEGQQEVYGATQHRYQQNNPQFPAKKVHRDITDVHTLNAQAAQEIERLRNQTAQELERLRNQKDMDIAELNKLNLEASQEIERTMQKKEQYKFWLTEMQKEVAELKQKLEVAYQTIETKTQQVTDLTTTLNKADSKKLDDLHNLQQKFEGVKYFKDQESLRLIDKLNKQREEAQVAILDCESLKKQVEELKNQNETLSYEKIEAWDRVAKAEKESEKTKQLVKKIKGLEAAKNQLEQEKIEALKNQVDIAEVEALRQNLARFEEEKKAWESWRKQAEIQQKVAKSIPSLSLECLVRVYAGMFSADTTVEELRCLFSEFGWVKNIKLLMSNSKVNDEISLYAFIDYYIPEAASLAISCLHKVGFKNTILKVTRADRIPDRVGFSTSFIQGLMEDADQFHRIYISSIHKDVTEEQVKSVFQAFGTVVSIQLAATTVEGAKHGGYGFVQFNNGKSCAEAVAAMDKFNLGGQLLRVTKAITAPAPLPFGSAEEETLLRQQLTKLSLENEGLRQRNDDFAAKIEAIRENQKHAEKETERRIEAMKDETTKNASNVTAAAQKVIEQMKLKVREETRKREELEKKFQQDQKVFEERAKKENENERNLTLQLAGEVEKMPKLIQALTEMNLKNDRLQQEKNEALKEIENLKKSLEDQRNAALSEMETLKGILKQKSQGEKQITEEAEKRINKLSNALKEELEKTERLEDMINSQRQDHWKPTKDSESSAKTSSSNKELENEAKQLAQLLQTLGQKFERISDNLKKLHNNCAETTARGSESGQSVSSSNQNKELIDFSGKLAQTLQMLGPKLIAKSETLTKLVL